MHTSPFLVVIGCLLTALGVVLLLLAPGGHVNKRDYSGLSLRVYRIANGSDLVLVVASLIAAVLAFTGHGGAIVAALLIAALVAVVLVLDLTRIYPPTRDSVPTALLALEFGDLALSAAVVAVAIIGLFTN